MRVRFSLAAQTKQPAHVGCFVLAIYGIIESKLTLKYNKMAIKCLNFMRLPQISLIGYFIIAILALYFLWRERKKPSQWCGRYRLQIYHFAALLILFGIFLLANLISIYLVWLGIILLITSFIAPHFLVVNKQNIKINALTGIKIAFVADLQLGMSWKKTKWAQKIVDKIKDAKPDLVLLGGDLIDNEGGFADECSYLSPFGLIANQFPIYYVMGNHEYGAGQQSIFMFENQADKLARTMAKLNIPLLKNNLVTIKINNKEINIFGIDDIWGGKADFAELNNWNKITPLIFLTHNPDGILSWPFNIKKPDLVLAGHTHGGQIHLPGLGPVVSAEIKLPRKHYRGLSHYNNIPIFTTVGAGESAAPIRFGVMPEVVVLEIK